MPKHKKCNNVGVVETRTVPALSLPEKKKEGVVQTGINDRECVVEEFKEDGFLFERKRLVINGKPKGQGRIIAVTYGNRRIEVRDRVIANGRMFVEAGRLGSVTAIHLPHREGRTSDIIDVLFDGSGEEPIPAHMKFKDLLQ